MTQFRANQDSSGKLNPGSMVVTFDPGYTRCPEHIRVSKNQIRNDWGELPEDIIEAKHGIRVESTVFETSSVSQRSATSRESSIFSQRATGTRFTEMS